MRLILCVLVGLFCFANLAAAGDGADPFVADNQVAMLSPRDAISSALAKFKGDCQCGDGCRCAVPCVCGGGEVQLGALRVPAGWTCGPNGCYPPATVVAQAPAVTVQTPRVGVSVGTTPTYVCPCCGMVMPTPPKAMVTYSAPMTAYTTTSYAAPGDVLTVGVGVTAREGFLGRWRARRAARLASMGY